MFVTADVLQMVPFQMLWEHLFTQLIGSSAANKGNLQRFWQSTRTPVCFHGVLSSYLFFFLFWLRFYIMIYFLVNYWIAPHFFNISFGSVFFCSISSVSLGFFFSFTLCFMVVCWFFASFWYFVTYFY